MREFTKYQNTNPAKMIVYLEKRYAFDFPDSISDAKAAKRMTGFDGSSSFIMKFHIERDDVEAFVSSLGVLAESHVFFDERQRESYPAWYKTPITTGKLSRIRRRKSIHNADWSFYVYIDLGNEQEPVIYLEGCYSM